MSHLPQSTSPLQSTERIGQGAISPDPQQRSNSPHTASIHILNDDILLYLFLLYRPCILDRDEVFDIVVISGGKGWDSERWWYQLAHVCQRWRILILESASYLDLCLVCTPGTPVADMLAHSPPLPLVIEFFHTGWDISAEEEERIILALQQRDRVYRVRIWMPVPNLQKVILAMDEEYPALDYLILGPSTQDYSTALILPETLQAPHLRHLLLMGFALPMGSRLLTAAVGLVILILVAPHPSAYFQPNILLQWLSFMSQLETLVIYFSFPVPDRDVERQLMHSSIPAHITLPNLLIFVFQGDNAYMEALVHRISTPCLKSLSIELFNQPTFSVPPFLPFISTIENRRFTFAKFWFFGEKVCVAFYPYGEAKMTTLHIDIGCWHLDWQCVSIEHETHSWSSEEHNEVDRAEWRKLLRPFNNVRLLYVYDGLVKELSRSLRLEAGDFPLDLLPELEELKYPGSSDTGDAFTSFVDARKNSGRPVTLVSDQVL